ncbi:hypothetical protein K8S17_00475 [bacterium]|nr:hypothetical protein [bacterium]
MKQLLIVVCILALAVPALAGRSIEGSYVELVSPTDPMPNTTYTFTFYVWNNSFDTEWITDVFLAFPDGYVLDAMSMAYDDPNPGLFVWDMVVEGQIAKWLDGDGGYGELYDQVGTNIYIDVTTPDVVAGEIYWELFGDIYGDEPHYVDGSILMGFTPVEEATWTGIKAMYR